MDGYADDLAAVIKALDLKDVTLVGHSTGGGEVTRYIGRHCQRKGRQPTLSSYAAARRIGPSCATSAQVAAH
jgi:non-heme chloroperoxidase